MPTARPRHQVTETDAVAHALDAAERRWPGEPRSRLIVRLVAESGERLAQSHADEADARNEVVERLAGSFTGVFPTGIRDELRDEWPE